MLTTHRTARILPVAAFLITALGACSDNSPPTAPLSIHPSFTQVAATPVVNSLNDPGTGVCDDTECTLREAITFASSGATITFAAGLTGTITLTSGELYLNKSLNINGPGPTALTISGGDAT
ncbi:MAG TPA: CSLREA domain-containing protein, partial [Gemmatimonadaceae bacterium]|nr:CSLREA domain-containing protein [Gemmatimonadaceae bacterium]